LVLARPLARAVEGRFLHADTVGRSLTLSQPFIPTAEAVALAAGLGTALATGKLHLYTAAANQPSRNSVIGDFTEAIFAGYAAAAVAAWSAAFADANGDGAVNMPSQNFSGPSSGAGQTLLGCYYTDTTSAHLLWAAAFDSPLPLTAAIDMLIIGAQVTLGGSGTITVSGTLNP
jgi:hypothetical protein